MVAIPISSPRKVPCHSTIPQYRLFIYSTYVSNLKKNQRWSDNLIPQHCWNEFYPFLSFSILTWGFTWFFFIFFTHLDIENIWKPFPCHFPMVPMARSLLTFLSMEMELGAVRLSPRLCAARSKAGKVISTGDLSKTTGAKFNVWGIMRNRWLKTFEIIVTSGLLSSLN